MKEDKKLSTTLAKLVSQFLEYLEVEKGNSPLTIRNYRHYLGRFLTWAEAKVNLINVMDINQDVIRKYRLHLSRFENDKGKRLSKKTQGYHAIALRSFLRWLLKNDYEVLSPDKIDLPKHSDREVKYLTGEQVDRILNAPTMSTLIGKRDKAILEVLFSTGLRVSELTKLNKNKINLDKREFGIIGKGGKTRIVFLSARAAGFVTKYLAARDDHYKPLFIRYSGKKGPETTDEQMRLTPRSVQRMVKKYVRKVKLPVEATPHVLRHSFATDLLMAGADLRSVQEMLGHKNVATTQVYTHVTNKRLREVHEKFHGVDKES